MKLKSMSFLDAQDIKGLYGSTLPDNLSFSVGDASYTLVTLGDLRDECDYGQENGEVEEQDLLNTINQAIAEHGEDTLVRFVG